MKFKYWLKKTFNIKSGYIIAIILVLVVAVVGYFSYAVFTARSESNSSLNIVTGNLYALIESSDLDSNKSITLVPRAEKTISLKLANVNKIDSKVNLYYSATSDDVRVGYLSLGDEAPDENGYVLKKTGEEGDRKEIYVKITNDSDSDVTVTFGASAGLANSDLQFPEGKNIITLTYECHNENSICIRSAADLINLANEVNNGDSKEGKEIYLYNDIDMGGKFNSDGSIIDGTTYWTSIGTEAAPFSGTFDGDGHVIKNLYINSDVTSTTGLFGYVSDKALITNFGIVNSYSVSSTNASMVVNELHGSINGVYNAGNVSGGESASSFASIMKGNSSIKNCYNTGNINSTTKASGIVYKTENSSSVTNVYNTGVVTSPDASGIVFENYGTVNNIYNYGNIVSSVMGGGIIHSMLGGSISNTCNIGNIQAGGGIMGSYEGDLPISKNYYLDGTAEYGIASISSDNNTNKLSSADMPHILNIINGEKAFVEDVNNVNNSYPLLKWTELKK